MRVALLLVLLSKVSAIVGAAAFAVAGGGGVGDIVVGGSGVAVSCSSGGMCDVGGDTRRPPAQPAQAPASVTAAPRR